MEADKAYFSTIPWCNNLLSGPNITTIPTSSRVPKSSTEDALIAETLKTPDTISACLTFYERPKSESDTTRINEIKTLLRLGYGVNGYPNIAHGGLIATLLDECMGGLIGVNKQRGVVIGSGKMVTKYLNVEYLRPVATPQTILVSAMFGEVVGRKNFIQAVVKDGEGNVLARGEGLWLSLREEGKL